MTTSSLTHIYHNHLQVNILETTTHRIESPGSLVLFGGGWVGGWGLTTSWNIFMHTS